MSQPKRPLLEFVAVSIAVLVAIHLLLMLGRISAGAGSIGAALVSLIFFWVPIVIILARRRTPAEYGLHFTGWQRELGRGLLVSSIVLPLFAVAYWVVWGLFFHRSISVHWGTALFLQFPVQLLAIALPEEVFFRGYLQTLFSFVWRTKRRWPLVGVNAPAIIATSIVFPLAHLASNPSPMRLAVFFPSLLFGVLRERSGSLVQPVVVHTLANVTILILENGVG